MAWAIPPAPIPPVRCTDCTPFIADGVLCYNTSTDKFYIGNGTTAIEIVNASNFIFPTAGVPVYDSNSTHPLYLKTDSNLTANHNLTFTTGDSDRTITFSGNPTLADWFDQAVKSASAVTFGTVDTGQGANELYDMDQNVLTSSTPQFAGLTFSTDLILGREDAAIFQLGSDAAGITNQTLKGPDRITSDGVGGNLTIAGGRNRGASVGGSIIFQTSPAAGAEVTGTLATALTIDSTKLATFAGAITTTNLTDSGLTITRIPFASTGGLLVDDADLTFATDTLSATKLISSTSVTTPQIYGSSADAGTLTLTSTSHVNKGTISVGRLTLSDLANANGIVFGDLGTATRGIDLSGSGLSGGDNFVYGSASNYWTADGTLKIGATFETDGEIHGGLIRVTTFLWAINPNDIVFNKSDYGIGSIVLGIGPNNAGLIGNYNKVGSLSSCSSNGTTTITKALHGLTLAVGELVHVTGSSTAADKGFYRYVSGDANTIVVDRALSGTQTDVALTVYKDIISMHATDGTNGQMLTSWSAQNKPMQLGGTVLGATANSLTSTDVVMGGMTEFMGNIYFKAGTSTGYSTPVGAINVTTTGVGNVDAGEDVLMTYSLPINALSANAKGIRVTVYGTIANNANAKTVKVYFGTTAIYTDSMTINQAYNWTAQYTSIRTGTDTQDVFGTGFVENTAMTVAPYYATDTQDDGAAIVIKCTGEGVASNDIVQQGMLVEYIN